MLTNDQMTAGRFLCLHKAREALSWINARLDEGRTVYVTTYTRRTAFKEKHRDMIRVRGGSLEAQYGRQWLDISGCHLTAR